MSTSPFISRLSDVSDCAGWTRVGSVWMTRLPLLDTASDTFAELTYALALSAAAAFGARLPSRSDIIALNIAALRLHPRPLPTVGMVHGWSETQIDAYRNANMGGLEWSRLHTGMVRDQLAVAAWDGRCPVANAGKHWIAGAPPGRAYLMGWWEGGAFIQNGTTAGQGPHNDQHHDYGTTTMLVRDDAPVEVADTDPAPPIGEAA